MSIKYLSYIFLAGCLFSCTNPKQNNIIEPLMQYIDAINMHNADSIAQHLSDDHLFIDGYGNEYRGKENMRKGWESYLTRFPDYSITVDEIIEGDSVIALFGFAEGTFADSNGINTGRHWKNTAAWKAKIESGKIAHWQIFIDYTASKKVRQN